MKQIQKVQIIALIILVITLLISVAVCAYSIVRVPQIKKK